MTKVLVQATGYTAPVERDVEMLVCQRIGEEIDALDPVSDAVQKADALESLLTRLISTLAGKGFLDADDINAVLSSSRFTVLSIVDDATSGPKP